MLTKNPEICIVINLCGGSIRCTVQFGHHIVCSVHTMYYLLFGRYGTSNEPEFSVVGTFFMPSLEQTDQPSLALGSELSKHILLKGQYSVHDISCDLVLKHII